MSSRIFRVGRWIVLGLVLLPSMLVLGVSFALKLTQLSDEPFEQIIMVVGGGLASTAVCAVTGCEPEFLEGMESLVFAEGLLEGTPVALEVDEWGRVLVAETARQNAGAEDNRGHPYWLMDDLASRTVEDRVAYYKKWTESGEIEDPNHFTSSADRLVLLEDVDGDERADTRTVLASWNEMASGLVAGIEAREGSILVTSIPSIYRVEDLDYDGVAESVETIHTGFGVKTSLIGHDLHGLVWGPDGKIYFSMGDRGYSVTSDEGEIFEPSMGPGRGAVFRMNPDGSDLQVFATGVRNPQELAFDDYGNLFTGDNNGDGGDSARIVYLVEGSETGWAMAFQSLAGDYVRGPWVAEGLWELQHETQPAWVLPPVAHIANGPAGFVHYPGLGLPERYANLFFLCDYAYTPGRTGIWSFRLTPEGAGMKMEERHKFAWSVLATDFDFGWDGRMFATIFDQFGGGKHVLQMRHPESQADPRVDELSRLVRQPMASQKTERLFELLSFPDQRLRLRAQYELVTREQVAGLIQVAKQADADVVPRLHALWGLGQLGKEALSALSLNGLEWLESAPLEVRAQFARVVGDAGQDELAPLFIQWLNDDSLRIRFFAAQALGALKVPSAVLPLADALRTNADEDVFLRHAIVWAWHRIDDLDAVWALRDDSSRSVRLGVLLALRNESDARISVFLDDEDPLLVVEAARAIYDLPLESAMTELAALAASLSPAKEEDTQTSQALHRRVIGANVRLRSPAGAGALARYVIDESQLESLREIALEALGAYSEPPLRDLTMGFYRPLAAADDEILASVLRSQGAALAESSLGGRALEIANENGELPLDDEELVELIGDASGDLGARVASMRALTSRAEVGQLSVDPAATIEGSLGSDSAALRMAARELRARVAPAAGLTGYVEATKGAETLVERQHAWRMLAGVPGGVSERVIAQGLMEWSEGNLEQGVALEVFEAAAGRGGDLEARSDLAMAGGAAASRGARPVDTRRWALSGGNAELGREIFQTIGDCQRCHGGGGGHGGGVGPSLEGVRAKGAEHVLESVLEPNAKIANGFASIVVRRRDGSSTSGLIVNEDASSLVLDIGAAYPVTIALDDIVERSAPISGMPSVGLGLAPQALRDVVAYVMTL